jgi:hypothetical protein
LGWPLLVLVGARLLAGGLALRRAKLSLLLGVWSVATLTAAAIGLAAGLLDHAAAPGMRVIDLPVAAGTHTGDILALQAATMALLGATLGWLPGVMAAIAYSVRRAAATVTEPEPAAAQAGTEIRTLDLAALETLRKARRRSLEGTLPDAGSSSFFAAD